MVEHGEELLGMAPIEKLKPLEETLELQHSKRSLTLVFQKKVPITRKEFPLLLMQSVYW